MQKMTNRFEKNTLIIDLYHHIDSANASEIESELLEIRRNTPDGGLVLDASEVEYISSAGLRIVLRLLKAEKDLKIINVQPAVYEIFDTTGFTDMMTVEKAYRRVSVDNCEIIGRGANGTVYRYDDETIVKTYNDENALEEMTLSRNLSRKAFVKGIPTAIPYDIVRVGNTYGAVYELLNATSITKLIKAEPENIEKHIKTFVEFMKLIHSTPVTPGEVPDMKKIVCDWADFLKGHITDDEWQKLHNMIASVPEHPYFIHGDYHSNNVMVQNGEPLLIDMDTLAYGHPVFELASIFNAFIGFSSVDKDVSFRFFNLSFDTTSRMWELTLKMYLDTDDKEVLESVANKAKIIGYTRILRRTIRREADTEDGQRLIAFCKKQISELLEKEDSLIF